MKKRSLLRPCAVTLLIAFAAFSFTSCEDHGCGEGPEPSGNCNVYATAQNVMCGNGVWKNIWLKLDDGTYLQPLESGVANVNLVDGQRYKIGYEAMPRDSRYDHTVNCLAVPPDATPVRVFCLQTDSEAAAVKK